MAEVVAAMALTHSPGLTGWFERAPVEQPQQARAAVAWRSGTGMVVWKELA